MPIEITIPRLGWSMDEGNFMSWLKQDGELVKAGEPLFTLESEKAAQDIEATDAGVLKLQPGSPKAGDVVKVGQVIGLLLAENENSTPVAPAAAPAIHVAETARPESAVVVDGKGKSAATAATVPASAFHVQPAISPRARRRAAELGVDITKLKGSGPSGRITEEDVLKGAASAPKAEPAPAAKTSIMRRLIAQRTATSFATIPHFYLRAEVDATELVRLREDLLPEIESATGLRVTLSDFLLRAQALALKDFPAANCIWADDALVPLPACDVGLVVGLPEGLMIPVLRAANEDDLAAVTKQRAALVAAAKAGKLTQEQMQGGATSFSNLGNSPVDEFAAVISPGQSSMLAIGRAIPRPCGFGGKLALRTTLKLCLSVDHRVLDGGPAGEFLGRIVEYLECPAKVV
jgi:pyruvate dehydrogenase E2 component (dihydrolipoamide acetyltransferase)